MSQDQQLAALTAATRGRLRAPAAALRAHPVELQGSLARQPGGHRRTGGEVRRRAGYRSCAGSGCCRSTTRWPPPRTTAASGRRSSASIASSRPLSSRRGCAKRWRRTWRSSASWSKRSKERAEQRGARRRARFARGAAAAAAPEVGRRDRCHRLFGRDRRCAGAGPGRPRLGRGDGAHARRAAAERCARTAGTAPAPAGFRPWRRQHRRAPAAAGGALAHKEMTAVPSSTFLATLPGWAATLARTVAAKQANTFVIHGLPADLIPVRQESGLTFQLARHLPRRGCSSPAGRRGSRTTAPRGSDSPRRRRNSTSSTG